MGTSCVFSLIVSPKGGGCQPFLNLMAHRNFRRLEGKPPYRSAQSNVDWRGVEGAAPYGKGAIIVYTLLAPTKRKAEIQGGSKTRPYYVYMC